MHINRGLLGWGVFLIALGVEALAVRSGVLDAALARRALEVWPLILIAIGLDLILRRTVAGSLGTILVALVFALMAGALFAATPASGNSTGFCGGVPTGTDSAPHMMPTGPASSGTLTGPATVTITADCGKVTVDAVDGSDYRLGWQGAERALMPAVDASESSLSLRRNNAGGVNVGSPATDWTVSLPRDPVLDLTLKLNAGSATANLAGARIGSLTATVNAGDAKLDAGKVASLAFVGATANAGSVSITLPVPEAPLTGDLTVNAGTLRLCVPSGTALRIRVAHETLASDNFTQRGLARDGNVWTRPGANVSAAGIDLAVSANLGTIALDPEEGCG